MRLDVIPYSNARLGEWDQVVGRSRNATFLHYRAFMDYHGARFDDASVLICDDSNQALAVFPANRVADMVCSHGGLTYGALLMPAGFAQVECIAAFDAIAEYYVAQGIRSVIYKAVPHVFHKTVVEEDLYALTRLGAHLVRRDVSCAVELAARLPYSKGRRWSVAKASKCGVIDIVESVDPQSFHGLLTVVLARHGVSPVHSVEELVLLRSRFPSGIRLFEARRGQVLLAGALVFDFEHIVHTQYLAVSDEGRALFALDLLLDRLLSDVFSTRKYFSFGISTEDQGRALNVGLQRYKEGFGARAVVHDVYEWAL